MFWKKDILCHIDKKPCIKERCNGWYVDVLERRQPDGTYAPIQEGHCYKTWELIYFKAIAKRTDGTQRTTEQLRNIVKFGPRPVKEVEWDGKQ